MIELLMQRFDGAMQISIAEAGGVLGVSTSTAYRMANDGLLPTVGMGKRRRVPLADLARLLEKGTDTASDDRSGNK